MKKKYDKQFKEEAVGLPNEIGVKKAAEQLGVPYHTLSDWRSKKRDQGAGAFAPLCRHGWENSAGNRVGA